MPRPVVSALTLLLALSGCSGAVKGDDIRSAEGSITGLTVAGEPGTPPTVRMAAPLRVEETRSEVLVAGTGAPVQVDQLFVVQLTLYDARTGQKVLSTYDGVAPVVAKNTDDTLFPSLSAALVGVRQGSRLVLALTAADAYGGGGRPPVGVRTDDPVVVIADVAAVPPTEVATSASGTAEPVRSGAPQVALSGTDPVSVGFSGSTAPAGPTIIALVTGTGPVVRDHSLVTLDFLGQFWGAAEPFTDTYFKEPVVVPVGAEGSVPTWDATLVGIHQGSRVLVIGPAGPAGIAVGPGIRKNDLVAWVVDVLGVS